MKNQVIEVIDPLTQEKTTHPDQDYYRPFTNVARRDLMQETVEVPVLVRMMKLPCNKRMLEVGCGPGFALVPLARLCKPSRLVGIDIDKESLAYARKRFKAKHASAELYQEDVRYMPFQDESFDIVIDFGTCYHIRHPLKAIKEVARILTVGGLFVYETPLNQLLSHPVRSFGRKIPWGKVPDLVPHRKAVLWASRIKRNYITDGSVYDTKNSIISTDTLVTEKAASCENHEIAIPREKRSSIKRQKIQPGQALISKIVSVIGIFAVLGAR